MERGMRRKRQLARMRRIMEKMRSKFQNARATKMVAGANVREKKQE
jgi:hypothetical protein